MAKYFKIKDSETLELFIVISDVQPENTVLVTDENSNFIKPKANQINFTEVVEGATQEEIVEATNASIPEEINAIQFFIQLELIGITEQNLIDKVIFLYENGMLSNEDKITALVSIKKANIFNRNHPFIELIGAAFEKTKVQLDNVFINGNLL